MRGGYLRISTVFQKGFKVDVQWRKLMSLPNRLQFFAFQFPRYNPFFIIEALYVLRLGWTEKPTNNAYLYQKGSYDIGGYLQTNFFA